MDSFRAHPESSMKVCLGQGRDKQDLFCSGNTEVEIIRGGNNCAEPA